MIDAKAPGIDKKIWFIIMLAFLPILILRDLTPANEGRYLIIADEAIRSGNFFSFTLHGEPYADKPPFYLWLVMLCHWISGGHYMILLSLLSFIPACAITTIMLSWTNNLFSKQKKKDGHLDANDHCLLCCSAIGCTHGHADGAVHSAGFSFQFVYQWYYSYRRHASHLPLGFWIISLIGSGTIAIYGIIRRDPVLILGQSFGFVAYARNNVLLFRQHKTDGQ